MIGSVCVLSFGVGEVDMNNSIPLEDMLQIHAQKMNEVLPKMIDTKIRHDKVEVEKETLIYRFTLVTVSSEEMGARRFHELMESDIKNSVCGDIERQEMLKDGVAFDYVYRGKNKKHITQFLYDAEACGLERNEETPKESLYWNGYFNFRM